MTNRIDNPGILRARRIEQYTYTPVQRTLQRVRGFLASVTPGALGADYSYWQSTVNFAFSKAKGILWAYIRALYGLSVDLKFPVHFKNSKGVMPRTAYLYYLDALDPKAQAQKLYEICLANGDIGDYQPVIDVESINNATLTASKIKTCCDEILNLFNKRPLIYSGYYVWRDAVKGDKTWAAIYSLIIAAYPFSDWTPDLPQKVLQYPPMIPAPFKMWTSDPDENMAGKVVGWQFTSSAKASDFGVSGNFLDLDWSSPAFQKQVLNGVPPPVPPPPTGDFMVKFQVDNKMNIRNLPSISGTDIGDLPAGTIITALDVVADTASSVWLKIADGQWCALTHAGTVYLEHL